MFVVNTSELPRCRNAAICYMLFRVIREIKVSSAWFACVLVISFYVVKVFSELVT